MKIGIVAFLAAWACFAPALAQTQNQSIRLMSNGIYSGNNPSSCHNKHRAIEERIRACQADVKKGHYDEYGALAKLQRTAGQYDAALAAVARLTERLPDIPTDRVTAQDWVWVLMLRSDIYAQMGRFDDAKKDADEIGRIGSDETENLNQQCWVRAVAGKELDAALDACNRSLERKPREADTMDSRGLVYFKLGRFQEALADYDAALHRDSDRNETRFARGVTKLRLGGAKGGNEDIDDAKDRDASVAQALAGYGVAP